MSICFYLRLNFWQLLKKVFGMSNFKGNVAFNTLSFWSMKTAMRFHYDDCTNFDQDEAEVSAVSYSTPAELEEASKVSDLCLTCKQQDDTKNMHQIRFLRSFTRGHVQVRISDWLLLTRPHDGLQLIAQVMEIAEVFIPGCSLLRILASEVRKVEGVDVTRGGVITMSRLQPPFLEQMCVNVEYVHIQELHCDSRESNQYTFTSMY